MTRIKLKILLACLLAVALILCALLIVVNVALPRDLERQAKIAIKNEFADYDPGREETKSVNFLSASVGYIEIDQAGEDFYYLTDTEKAVLAFCADKKLGGGDFYRIKGKNRDIVLATYSSAEDLSEDFVYALYVDISAILSYVKWLNIMFCSAVVVVGAVICGMGLKLGKTIETAQEIRQSFFQNASHELKTPLMAIQGYAEGIQTEVLPAKESASVILEESDRMTTLIEELLALSKIDSEQTKPDFKQQDVNQIVGSVVYSLSPAFENSGKQLTQELCNEAIVSVDEKQMRKAISNLVANAFKYCKTAVFVKCVDDRDKVTVTISDDGDGIAKEDLPHVFDRFYTGKTGNTGIGLALTKEIVKLHGGEIKAYNKNGAVFELSLPKAKNVAK